LQEGKLTNGQSSGICVHVGHGTTHITPVDYGSWNVGQAKRLNLGGVSQSELLSKALNLRYP